MHNISETDAANLRKLPDPRLCNQFHGLIFHYISWAPAGHLPAANFAGHVQPRHSLQPWRWHICWFRRGSQLVSARSWYGTHHGCSVSLFFLYIYIISYYIIYMCVCVFGRKTVERNSLSIFFAQFYCLQRSLSLRLSTTWAIRTWHHGCKRPGDARRCQQSKAFLNQCPLLSFSVASGISTSADKHIPLIALAWVITHWSGYFCVCFGFGPSMVYYG